MIETEKEPLLRMGQPQTKETIKREFRYALDMMEKLLTPDISDISDISGQIILPEQASFCKEFLEKNMKALKDKKQANGEEVLSDTKALLFCYVFEMGYYLSQFEVSYPLMPNCSVFSSLVRVIKRIKSLRIEDVKLCYIRAKDENHKALIDRINKLLESKKEQ